MPPFRPPLTHRHGRFSLLALLALLGSGLLHSPQATAETVNDGYFIDLLRLRVKQLAEQAPATTPQQPLWGRAASNNGRIELLQAIDQARQQAPAGNAPASSMPSNDSDSPRSCIDNLHVRSDGSASRNPLRACTTRYATRSYMQKGVYPLLGATVQGRLPNSTAEVGFIPPNITFLTFYTQTGRVSEVLLVSNDSEEAATTTR